MTLEPGSLLVRLSAARDLSEARGTLNDFPSSMAFSLASRAAILADVLQWGSLIMLEQRAMIRAHLTPLSRVSDTMLGSHVSDTLSS